MATTALETVRLERRSGRDLRVGAGL